MKPSDAARRTRVLLVAVSVSALFFFLSFRKIDAARVWGSIETVDVSIVLLSLVSKGFGFVLMALRSRILLRSTGRAAFVTMLRSLFLAFAGNNLLLFRMGDVFRIDYLARKVSVSRASSLAVISFERLLDVFSLVVIIIVSLPLIAVRVPLRASFLMIAGAVSLAIASAILTSHHGSRAVDLARRIARLAGFRASDLVGQKAEAFVGGLAALRSPLSVISVVLLSFAIWLTSLASIQIWFRAFSLALPWYAAIVVVAFLSFGIAIPTSPGQVGTYHYFVMEALRFLGVERSVALSFAIVGHAVAVVPFTLIALPLLLFEYARQSQRSEAAADLSEDAVTSAPSPRTIRSR